MIKAYTQTLNSLNEIEVGKTYYKCKLFGWPLGMPLFEIKVMAHSSPNCTVIVNGNGIEQTWSEAAVLNYINKQCGYSDTP